MNSVYRPATTIRRLNNADKKRKCSFNCVVLWAYIPAIFNIFSYQNLHLTLERRRNNFLDIFIRIHLRYTNILQDISWSILSSNTQLPRDLVCKKVANLGTGLDHTRVKTIERLTKFLHARKSQRLTSDWFLPGKISLASRIIQSVNFRMIIKMVVIDLVKESEVIISLACTRIK